MPLASNPLRRLLRPIPVAVICAMAAVGALAVDPPVPGAGASDGPTTTTTTIPLR